MTGGALFNFLISIVLLVGVGFLFFYAIEGFSPDAKFTQIAKLAVGLVLVVIFLEAVKAVLFGGGGGLNISPAGVISFAIGVIVVLVVMFFVKWVVAQFLPQFVEPIMYVLGAVALIALLVLAQKVLFGGGIDMNFLKQGTLALPRYA